MEIIYLKGVFSFEKDLNSLDVFTLDFCSILEKFDVDYVLVSGYVSILFGRNRASEDVDIIVEKLDFDKFKSLWSALYNDFECLNTEIVKEAYDDYLLTGLAIRFSKKGRFIPNMELKFPKIELDFWTLKNRKKVVLNKKVLYISPLELQIPFKLFLGSEKDIEDAKHLYLLFEDKLDLKLLYEFNRKLEIEDSFKRYLE
jgi:hypothetical protein